MTPSKAIDKAQVVFDKTRSDKETIDELLHIDAQMYQYLGTDTSKTEKDAVKRASAFIYRLIKSIDPERGQRYIQAMGLTR